VDAHLPRLGKAPFTPDARDLRFSSYVSSLPAVPTTFGHDRLIKPAAWGMLGNDEQGDCVWAGAAHETMLWNAEAGRHVGFTTSGVLSDYHQVAGPGDDGTVVRDAYSFRKATGVQDASGRRHRIGAYVQLEPGNVDHLWQALYLFGAVGIGIRFPSSAMSQFQAGQRWSVVPGSPVEGGHYIPVVARRDGIVCVTWGREQRMTKGFYEEYCDEAWATVSVEALTGKRSLEGFDLAALNVDLQKVRGA
jgi:hypothetical protein